MDTLGPSSDLSLSGLGRSWWGEGTIEDGSRGAKPCLRWPGEAQHEPRVQTQDRVCRAAGEAWASLTHTALGPGVGTQVWRPGKADV